MKAPRVNVGEAFKRTSLSYVEYPVQGPYPVPIPEQNTVNVPGEAPMDPSGYSEHTI